MKLHRILAALSLSLAFGCLQPIAPDSAHLDAVQAEESELGGWLRLVGGDGLEDPVSVRVVNPENEQIMEASLLAGEEAQVRVEGHGAFYVVFFYPSGKSLEIPLIAVAENRTFVIPAR